MEHSTFNGQASSRFQSAGRNLRRAVDRSPQLGLALTIGLNAGGCLLMLSPVIMLVALTSVAISVGNNIQGPLDWLVVEVCAAGSLFAAAICWQLYRMRPASADGVTITAEHEARLFSMIERRRSHFGVAPFDNVRLTTDCDIKVVATPRWPLPLLHSYTLSLGVALLFFVSEAQFRLTLAGAVAANARMRRSASGWAWQAAQDWLVIIDTLQAHPGLASRLLLPALRRLAAANALLGQEPVAGTLQAQSHWILEHTDEQTTRELLSSQVLAAAFTQHHYWPAMLKGAEHCPAPVVHPFSHFALLLKGAYTREAARRWLLRAQANAGRMQDLLAELRIDFLQCPALPETSAFEAIFEHTAILKTLDQHWRERILPEWQRLHSDFQAQKRRFEQLQQRSQQHELRGDSAINFVRLARKFLDREQAIKVFRKVYRENPDDPAVSYACGEAMLAARHSLEGCDALQRAADLDERLANRAHTLISQHKQDWMKRRPGIARNDKLARIA